MQSKIKLFFLESDAHEKVWSATASRRAKYVAFLLLQSLEFFMREKIKMGIVKLLYDTFAHLKIFAYVH